VTVGRHRRFALYVHCGIAATLVHYAVLVFLVEVGRWGAPLSAAAGASLGALVGYVCNRRITFRTTRVRHQQALPRFLTVATLAASTSAMVVLVLEPYLGYLPGQALATAILLFLTFGINRGWTFAEHHEKRA
jgi:putative flippase GtrA